MDTQYRFHSQKRKSRFPLLVLFLIILFLFVGLYFYWQMLLSPIDSKAAQKEFTVAKGEGVSSIASRLEKDGLIRSSLAFKIALKLSGDIKIEAGNFTLSPAMSVNQLINSLRQSSTDKWVKLIEGWRVEEMAEVIQNSLGIKKDDFLLVAKEGYMFPDSYRFSPDTTASDVAKTLKDNFNQKYAEDIKRGIRNNGLTEDQGVILASLVEREARTSEVRKNVASILLKRLKMGMKLDVDATVQYALGYQPDEKSWWKKSLTTDDLTTDSPYNTYLINGLPPTPICNPSLASLKAVAEADSSIPYLFYYHDSKGNTYYAKTLEEHEANAARYK